MGNETRTEDRDDWRRYAAGRTCTVTQAAAIMGVSRGTVWGMIQDGRLYGWRPNGCKKYLLWEMQIREVVAKAQAQAVKNARLAQGQIEFSFI